MRRRRVDVDLHPKRRFQVDADMESDGETHFPREAKLDLGSPPRRGGGSPATGLHWLKSEANSDTHRIYHTRLRETCQSTRIAKVTSFCIYTKITEVAAMFIGPI